MSKAQESEFIITEAFLSESEEERRERLRRIVDDYLRLKLQT